MITRRTLEGAEKCALRDFLREEWRAIFFKSVLRKMIKVQKHHTCVYFRHGGGGLILSLAV